jgi:hypothetical protein
MKIKAILLSLAVGATLLVGCAANKEEAKKEPTKTEDVTPEPEKTEETEPVVSDVVTTASLVDTEAAFESAISSEGTWIISTIKDLTFDKDIVVEGEIKNTKEPAVLQRKIALYTQDDDRNVTNRFTLTAPKLTFSSPAGSIEHGIFVGDLYITANDFALKDAKVEGNVYFTTDEAKSTFTMDETSEVTGVQELKK